jgi:hypothetical protein
VRAYVRIVRRPLEGKAGEVQARIIKRVEVFDGERTIELPVQDLNIQHPVSGPSFVTFSTPFFLEVTETEVNPE